jgi:hypothetical protein
MMEACASTHNIGVSVGDSVGTIVINWNTGADA